MAKLQLRKILSTALLVAFIPASSIFAAEPATNLDPTPMLTLTNEQAEADGVIHREYTGITVDGKPLTLDVLEVDLAVPGVSLFPVIPKNGVTSRSRLSNLAADSGGVAAVNGGFFVTGNDTSFPIGHAVVEGVPRVKWDVWRPSVSLGIQGLKFGFFQPVLEVIFAGGKVLPVDKLNSTPKSMETALFTSDWGNKPLPGGERLWVELEGKINGDAAIINVSRQASTLSADTILLALPPSGFEAWAVPGEKISISYAYPSWPDEVEHLLTGGPLLVEDGRPVFQARAEGFDGSILDRNPRTAVAMHQNGKVLFVTVDGRKPELSVGVTFEEFSLLLAALGAREAIGLDGGGSTEMWINGRIANNLSEGTERLLPNALVVQSGIPVWLNERRLYFDVQPRVVNGRTLVPLRGIFEAMGALVTWEEQSRTVTINLQDKLFKLPLDSREVMINEKEYLLDVPSQMVNYRTMVPLRFIMESLGAQVEWVESKGWVKIYAE